MNFHFHNNTNVSKFPRSTHLQNPVGSGLSVRAHGACYVSTYCWSGPNQLHRTAGLNFVSTAPTGEVEEKAKLTSRASFQCNIRNARRAVCGSVHDVGKVLLFIPETAQILLKRAELRLLLLMLPGPERTRHCPLTDTTGTLSKCTAVTGRLTHLRESVLANSSPYCII